MRIRPARADDREFILGLAPRLVEFGDVPRREASQMIERDRAVLAGAIDAPPPDTEVFIAEADDAAKLGYIHLTTSSDYYTEGVTAHVADIVVASAAEGRGVARARRLRDARLRRRVDPLHQTPAAVITSRSSMSARAGRCRRHARNRRPALSSHRRER